MYSEKQRMMTAVGIPAFGVFAIGIVMAIRNLAASLSGSHDVVLYATIAAVVVMIPLNRIYMKWLKAKV